jgi:hypothetical protein
MVLLVSMADLSVGRYSLAAADAFEAGRQSELTSRNACSACERAWWSDRELVCG